MTKIHKSSLLHLLRSDGTPSTVAAACLAALEADSRQELESAAAPANELATTYAIKLNAARHADVEPSGVESLIDELRTRGGSPVLVFAVSDGKSNYGIFTDEDLGHLIGRYSIPARSSEGTNSPT